MAVTGRLSDGESELLEEARQEGFAVLLAESGICTGCGEVLGWWEEGAEMCTDCQRLVARMREREEVTR